MMRGLLVLLLLALTSQAQAFEFWDQLWRNADQRGDALLQRGDAAKATQAYRDPQRKAYAKLAAGDYQGAAKDLESVHDSDAEYNRGNALAHAGDLQGALDAYDAALRSNPQNLDAKHNRDIVANALKQQPPSQQKKPDSKQSQGGNKSGEQGKPGEQNKPGGQDKNAAADKAAQGAGPAEQQNPAAQKQNSAVQDKQQDKASQSQDSKAQDSKAQSAKQDDAKSGTAQADKAAAQAQDAAEQARRDAEASLGKQAADAKNGAVAGEEKNAAPPAAKSEQQIAQEQWLRSIPDDPGGLLRRKFMIEHMIRQQKVPQ